MRAVRAFLFLLSILHCTCFCHLKYPESRVVANLPHKALIFHEFQGPTIKFDDPPSLENEILKFHDFPGFP